MKLSTTLIPIISLLILSCSCQKEKESVYSSSYPSVSGRVQVALTMSSQNSDSLQFFFFDSTTGKVAMQYSLPYADTIDLLAPDNVMLDVFAISNAPAKTFDKIEDRESFDKLLSDLADNSSSRQVMTWSGHKLFTEPSALDITLKRLVCGIKLQAVTPYFMGTCYAGKSVIFNRAYLINVCGNAAYCNNGYVDNDRWYNKMGFSRDLPENISAFTLHNVNRDVSTADTIKVSNTFIMYPNSMESDSSEDLWSPRRTRLVLEFSIDGKIEYFPLTLPTTQSGKLYIIDNVVLKGPGSYSPDLPIQRSYLTYNITVNPFEEMEIDTELEQ